MSQAELRMRLTREGFREDSPARNIIDLNGGVWSAGAQQAQISSLAQNFYTYGRNSGWVWTSAGNGIGNPMKDAVNYGRPLLDGRINGTNCGGFGGAFRKLAELTLQIPRGANNQGTGCNDSFITMPGNPGIDPHWTGNVRTLTTDFNLFNAYMFRQHGWSNIGGRQIDVSTNTIVQSKLDFFGCHLQNVTSTLHYLVGVRHPTTLIPGNPPYYCLKIGQLKQERAMLPIVLTGGAQGLTQSFVNALPSNSGGGNWGNWILVSRDHMSVQLRQYLRAG